MWRWLWVSISLLCQSRNIKFVLPPLFQKQQVASFINCFTFCTQTYSANSAFIFLLNTVNGKVIDTGVSVHLLDSHRDLRPNVCWKFTQREFRGRLCIRSQRASSKFVFKFETAQILRYKYRRNLWKCRNASSYRHSTKVMKGKVMLLVKWKEHICGLYKQKRLYKLSNCYNFNTSRANIIHLC